MSSETDLHGTPLGLLANGSSGRWSVDIDEALDGSEWYLQLDGPTLYLVVQLTDLSTVRRATHNLGSDTVEGELILGHFGERTVRLIRDTEEAGRHFLVVGTKSPCTMRVSLDSEDVRMLHEALQQAAEDLSPI